MPSPKRTIKLGVHKASAKDWHTEATLDAVKGFAHDLDRLVYEYERTMTLRDNAICDAVDGGVAPADLARLANVSRQQIYNISSKGTKPVPPEWTSS